jgi:hypothetical protein
VREGGIHDAKQVAVGGEPRFEVRALTELPQVLGV